MTDREKIVEILERNKVVLPMTGTVISDFELLLREARYMWVPVRGFEGSYEVSNRGEVK